MLHHLLILTIVGLTSATPVHPDTHDFYGRVSQGHRFARSVRGSPMKEYLKFRETPPQIMTAEHRDSIVLQCSAGGNPAPILYWMKNGQVITKDAFIGLREEMIETNNILPTPTGPTISNTIARLFLDCLSPEDEGVYTCVAETQFRQERTDTILSIQGVSLDNICTTKFTPRIEQWTSMQGTIQGSTATLLCRADQNKGDVIWYDPKGNEITSGNKYTVTSYGDLKIHDLDWKDMGQYKCQASSKYGHDEKEMFLYPFAREPVMV